MADKYTVVDEALLASVSHTVSSSVERTLEKMVEDGKFKQKCCEFCEITPQVHNSDHVFIGHIRGMLAKVTDRAVLTLTGLFVLAVAGIVAAHLWGVPK